VNKDYYKILGVRREATSDEIKRAYRILANKYHPDKCPDNDEAEAMFKEVAEAYACLGDGSNRISYDSGSYDGRKNKSLEEKAQELLFQAFATVLETQDEDQVKYNNPFDILRISINGAINNLKINMVDLESDKRKYIEARDRITGTNTLLFDVANSNVKRLDEISDRANEELQELSATLILLDDYQYKVDETENMSHMPGLFSNFNQTTW